MNKFDFPGNKKFIFTIIDDADDSFFSNTKPIYDFLYKKGVLITKTIWVYPPRDEGSKGDSLQNNDYRDFVSDLNKKGFEIALHHVGSGTYYREEILRGLEEYKDLLGCYPNMHINHSYNVDSIYGGYKRFSFPFNRIIKMFYPQYSQTFQGEVPGSPHFWGDKHKQMIKFSRNYEIDQLNTCKFDPKMPYIDESKTDYSNYWFSATFAPNQWLFNRLVTKNAIDKLEKEHGICILFTHLGYYMQDGKIDSGFIEKIEYISSKEGWFVPVSEVLDFMIENRPWDTRITRLDKIKLEFLHLWTRLKYRKLIKLDDYAFKKL